jgi:hypothetical protein
MRGGGWSNVLVTSEPDRWPRGAHFCGNYRNLFLVRPIGSIASKSGFGDWFAYGRAESKEQMQCGEMDGREAEQGGRGFKSLERSHPATAPTLMRRFFLAPKLLIFSKEIKLFKRAWPNSFDRTRPVDRVGPRLRPFIFPARSGAIASEKLSRNSRGGRGAMHLRGKHE